jgi:rhodanese-related sulfurtransferase
MFFILVPAFVPWLFIVASQSVHRQCFYCAVISYPSVMLLVHLLGVSLLLLLRSILFMKKLSLIFLIGIAFILATFKARAQVKSKSFGFVLKRLLSHNVPEIPVSTVAALPGAYTFLDAREYDEFSVSHLPSAIHVGYKDFKVDSLKNIIRNKPVIVYCSIGKRSEDITGILIKQGYTKVYNLYGGIFEWVNQGHAVYDLQNKQTTNVHAYNWLWGRFLDKGNKVF